MKWIMAAGVGLAGLLAAWLLLFQLPEKEAAAPEQPSASVPEVEVDAASMETIYKSNCMGCHGSDYQGAMGPALSQVGSALDRERLYAKIAKGGGGMPAFEGRLSEDEIVGLANWLEDFK
ncbi:c-type cytochrome [Paenibacillus soyae]|uniref:Cytochrome c n=1 Tax=Paenibacillus soyae TaxID=2969249 RepID=A0A9X2S777_9BACL|nr:cytochrome c [Paenibacillus soyae]MCR2802760.1 cytochrome c [Paenibacillus soyae]